MAGMTQTQKDKAEKKVCIAIDKLIDLFDLDIDNGLRGTIQHIVDDLNSLNSEIGQQ